jgi:hypothetical protein
MGTIYQPEVAAGVILRAAHRRRREWLVGGSTVLTLLVNTIAPGLADRWLARRGYEGQQYDGAADSRRRDNLDAPVPGDHGAHGAFDDRAVDRSLQVELDRHRGWILAGIGLAAVGLWRFAGAFGARQQRRARLVNACEKR